MTGYISKCTDTITASKTIKTNQKLWITVLLSTHDTAFRSGNKAALRTVMANLSQAIRVVKHAPKSLFILNVHQEHLPDMLMVLHMPLKQL